MALDVAIIRLHAKSMAAYLSRRTDPDPARYIVAYLSAVYFNTYGVTEGDMGRLALEFIREYEIQSRQL